MDFPRFPDWLVYGAAAAAILAGALSRRERADAPPPPPPPPGAERVPLGPDSPFNPLAVIRTEGSGASVRGTAFTVSSAGVWLTAEFNLTRCARPALKVAEGRAVRARRAQGGADGLAILITEGAAPGLPVETASAAVHGRRAFLAGYTSGLPAEISGILIGKGELKAKTRGQDDAPGLVWSEAGRTKGLGPALTGLLGAPLVSPDGRVVGVVTGFDPRRGRIHSTSPQAITAALAAAGAEPSLNAPPGQITPQNYYRAADDLRRGRQVAQVLCLRDQPSSRPE